MAASSATPAPVIPPPTTTTSKGSAAMALRASAPARARPRERYQTSGAVPMGTHMLRIDESSKTLVAPAGPEFVPKRPPPATNSTR